MWVPFLVNRFFSKWTKEYDRLKPGALCILDQWGSVRSHVLSEQNRDFVKDSWLQS